MRDLFKILDILTTMRVEFCFHNHGKNDYFNFSVVDASEIKHYISGEDVDIIEKKLKVIWGHLLNAPKPTVSGMPMP